MLHAFISGTAVKDAARREGKNGAPFATCALLAHGEDGEGFIANVIAFGDAGEELARARKGDAVAVSGRARLTTWQKADGTTQFGLSVTAGSVTVSRPATTEGRRAGGGRQAAPYAEADGGPPW